MSEAQILGLDKPEGEKEMYSRLWYERISAELTTLPNRAFLPCARDSGIEYAVHRLPSADMPTVSIWLGQGSQSPPLGEALSEAITRGLGSRMLRKPVSVPQAIKVLVEYQGIFGPLHLVIGWADAYQPLVNSLIESAGNESSVLIVSDETRVTNPPLGFQIIEGDFLKMRFSEAVTEARGVLSDDLIAQLYKESQGRFERFKASLLGHIAESDADFRLAEPWAWNNELAIDGVLDALIQKGCWSDAFEIACARVPERLPEFIDSAGNFYLNKGAFEYLWSRLSALPPDIKRNEKVAYWLLSIAKATNRQREENRHAIEVLRESEAPEVRAITAVATPSSSMLEETRRAVTNLRSPATLRAHGFALALAGNRTEPIELFREAMRLAERARADHLVVACGIDIAEVEIRQGNYRSGAEWAQWALGEYSRRGLHEKLRYMSAVATLAFARILLGEVEVAKNLLEVIEVDEELVDVPGYEVVVSTLGDLAFVCGDLERAEMYYQGNHAKAPLEAFCFTALNLIGVHVARREPNQATRLAETAYAVSRSSTPYERALGELLVGISLSESDPDLAEQHLIASIEGLSRTTAEFHVAQATAWLAIVRLMKGRRKDAVEALRLGTVGIRELGPSGWNLLTGGHPLCDDVQALWTESEYEYEFHFLGARTIKANRKEVELGVRAAEIVAILAIHASGLSGERLHAYVYGDHPFSRSTLKANVSRLRESIPIGSSPYRIDATYQADFIRVLELIADGELQKALNKYKGSLLPESESPLIEDWREHIDQAVRIAVMESRDADHLIQLGNILDDDLEVWEFARNCVALNDYRRPVINARIRRIKANWAEEAHAP